jgi:hypothetical protein
MATVLQSPVTHRVLLDNISWQTYERLQREVGERHVRLTYDDGDLEIMTLSYAHENAGEHLSALVLLLALELGLRFAAGGSTTLRRRLRKKRLEPDKCFWFANERLMRVNGAGGRTRTRRPTSRWRSMSRAARSTAPASTPPCASRRSGVSIAASSASTGSAPRAGTKPASAAASFRFLIRPRSPTLPRTKPGSMELTLLRRYTEWLRNEVSLALKPGGSARRTSHEMDTVITPKRKDCP